MGAAMKYVASSDGLCSEAEYAYLDAGYSDGAWPLALLLPPLACAQGSLQIPATALHPVDCFAYCLAPCR